MYSIIIILILVACILLIGVVLIQNPKGGGLGQSFGGFNNQIMGVQRTTDFLEKATWGLVISIALLSLFTVFLVEKKDTTTETPKSQFDGKEMTTGIKPPPPPPTAQPNANAANPIQTDSTNK